MQHVEIHIEFISQYGSFKWWCLHFCISCLLPLLRPSPGCATTGIRRRGELPGGAQPVWTTCVESGGFRPSCRSLQGSTESFSLDVVNIPVEWRPTAAGNASVGPLRTEDRKPPGDSDLGPQGVWSSGLQLRKDKACMCLEKTKTSLFDNFGLDTVRPMNRTAMLHWFSDSYQRNPSPDASWSYLFWWMVFLSRRTNILEFSRNIFFIDWC